MPFARSRAFAALASWRSAMTTPPTTKRPVSAAMRMARESASGYARRKPVARRPREIDFAFRFASQSRHCGSSVMPSALYTIANRKNAA